MAVFARRRDAWLAEDLEGYLACFADEIVLETPMSAVEGIAAYRAMVERSLVALRPVSFDFHALAVDGPLVLAEWTIALEWRADGRALSYRGMSVCELVDGRIRWWREFYDPAALRPRRA
jgi:limonene-1,2-epoxide hydrolase